MCSRVGKGTARLARVPCPHVDAALLLTNTLKPRGHGATALGASAPLPTLQQMRDRSRTEWHGDERFPAPPRAAEPVHAVTPARGPPCLLPAQQAARIDYFARCGLPSRGAAHRLSSAH